MHRFKLSTHRPKVVHILGPPTIVGSPTPNPKEAGLFMWDTCVPLNVVSHC